MIQARRAPGLDQQHQRQQATGFGFGQQFHQQGAEPDGLAGQIRTRQVLAGRGEIPFIKDQINHLQYGVEPFVELLPFRHLIGNAGLADLVLGAHDALRHGRRGHQIGAGDFLGGEVAHFPQGQRHPGVGGQRRVAAGEDQPQAVIFQLFFLAGRRHVLFQAPGDLLLGGVEAGPSAQGVDGLEAAGGDQPGPGLFGNAVPWPLLHGGDEGVLQSLLGQIEIAQQTDERGQHPAGLRLVQRGHLTLQRR